MGLIQADQHSDLGVVDGRNGDKARNARALVGAVQLLACAALAADAVARQRGLLSRAACNDTLHQAAHRGGGLRADDAALHRRLHFLHNSAVRRRDFRHNVGLHQLAAVYHRTDRREHLQVADLAALPERAARQLHRAHPVRRVVFAAPDLARQVDARGLPQAEGRKVITEAFFSKPRTDLDKAGVAADSQPPGEGLGAVDMPVCTAEPRACDGYFTRAGEIVRGLTRPGVQRRRRRDKLEHAARLIQVTDGLVAPLCLLGLLQRGAALLAGQGIHSVTDFLIYKGPRRVRVVVGLAGHRQHGPGVDIHHDADAALGYMMLRHSGGQCAFEPVLNVRVDGQRQRAAGHGVHQRLVVRRHIVAPGVLGGQDAPVLPGQFVVVTQLQPPQARVVHVGKA